MIDAAMNWFTSRGWTPFDFQVQTWRAYLEGRSGLVHAPTGLGKSLAVWMGPLLDAIREQSDPSHVPHSNRAVSAQSTGAARRTRTSKRDAAPPIRVLWITPLRALAADTTTSLLEPVRGLNLPWTVESRTGDTTASLKQKQRDRLPTALVTTPESLSLLLTYPDSHERLASLQCVIVDEWHELLGTKRGIQTELGLARLRAWNPGLRVWGLSATLGNLDEAMRVLLGAPAPASSTAVPPQTPASSSRRPTIGVPSPRLIQGALDKRLEVHTLIPDDIERFPWAGHIGLRLLPRVLETIAQARSTLLFTNTRSQTEIWFRSIVYAKPDWLGTIAIHHGSIDHAVRGRVEAMLKTGAARCVVCTSSLDLGVDFSPVDQVIQLGSPKGVARLMQRAGRSGHQPGAVSRIVCVPTHAFELIEFAAAREALALGRVEAREPIDKPFDVLAQHLVTIAMGGGFNERDLLEEVRTTHAFRAITNEEWGWVMDFVRRGGSTLEAYPEFARVIPESVYLKRAREEEARKQLAAEAAQSASSDPYAFEPDFDPEDSIYKQPVATPVPPQAAPIPAPSGAAIVESGPSHWVVASKKIAMMHRMNIGTISADTMMKVQYTSGRTLGTIEESFIARLNEGDSFIFSGRVLELVRTQDMTALVRRSKRPRGVVPVWGGGRMPLSSRLSDAVRGKLEEARQGRFEGPEMQAVRPLLELQAARSHIPALDELLVERITLRDGEHVIVFPFDGRLVHEGLAALVAYRLSKVAPVSVHATATDYGFDINTPAGTRKKLVIDEPVLRAVLDEANLIDDLLACLNATQLARRRFRDVARVAGLIIQGYPGQRKPSRHLQASSDMFFDVFEEFDPANLLLSQAKREVLEEQLEVKRLRRTLQRLATLKFVFVDTPRLTPFAFPVWAEVFRGVNASSESWSQKVARMSEELDAAERALAAPRDTVASPAAPKSRTRRSRRASV